MAPTARLGARNGRNERLERELEDGDKAALDSLQLLALAKARRVGLYTSMLGGGE